MHSGPDLEAFTAALNRDIGRHDDGFFPPTDPTASISGRQLNCLLPFLGFFPLLLDLKCKIDFSAFSSFIAFFLF